MDLSAMEAQLAEMRATVTQSLDSLDSSRRTLGAIKVTTQARDGSLSMTLDATGRIEDLTFHSRDFDDVTPKELSADILAVYGEARAELQSAITEQMPAAPFTGMSMDSILDPGADFADIIPESMLTAMFPDRGSREGHGHG